MNSGLKGKLSAGLHRTYTTDNIESRRLDCGVPQGAVLGARMYTIYTRQLVYINQRHGLHHDSYADDTQIYTQCMDNEEARSEAAAKIENCITEIYT